MLAGGWIWVFKSQARWKRGKRVPETLRGGSAGHSVPPPQPRGCEALGVAQPHCCFLCAGLHLQGARCPPGPSGRGGRRWLWAGDRTGRSGWEDMGGGGLSSGLPLRLSPSRGSHPHWPQSTAPPDGLRGAAHAACVPTLDNALLVLSKSPNGRGSAGAGAPQPGLWTGHTHPPQLRGPTRVLTPFALPLSGARPTKDSPTRAAGRWAACRQARGAGGRAQPTALSPSLPLLSPGGFLCFANSHPDGVGLQAWLPRQGLGLSRPCSAQVWEPLPPASPHTKAATWAQGGRAALWMAATHPLGPGPAASCAGAGQKPAPPSLHPLLPLARHPTR